jgi:hypothetical protein
VDVGCLRQRQQQHVLRQGRACSLQVKFVPNGGGTAADDLYDITLVDTDSVDVLGGAGANLSATTRRRSRTPSFGTTTLYRYVHDGSRRSTWSWPTQGQRQGRHRLSVGPMTDGPVPGDSAGDGAAHYR